MTVWITISALTGTREYDEILKIIKTKKVGNTKIKIIKETFSSEDVILVFQISDNKLKECFNILKKKGLDPIVAVEDPRLSNCIFSFSFM